MIYLQNELNERLMALSCSWGWYICHHVIVMIIWRDVKAKVPRMELLLATYWSYCHNSFCIQVVMAQSAPRYILEKALVYSIYSILDNFRGCQQLKLTWGEWNWHNVISFSNPKVSKYQYVISSCYSSLTTCHLIWQTAKR